MATEQDSFKNAVDEILKVVIFENWLRFYFIAEEPGENGETLKIELPEKTVAKIRELYPAYLPLAEALNGKPLDFDASRGAILTFILDNLDGQKLPRGMVDTALSSSTFQRRLQLFNAWTLAHEAQLDAGFLDFGQWVELFRKWEASPGAQALLKAQSPDAKTDAKNPGKSESSRDN